MKGEKFTSMWFFLILLCAIYLFGCGSEVRTQDRPVSQVKKEIEGTSLEEGSGVSPVQEKGDIKSGELVPIWRHPEEGKSFKGEFILLFPEEVSFPSDVSPKDYVKSEPYREAYTECRGNMVVYTMLESVPYGMESIQLCIHPGLQSVSGKRISKEATCYKLPLKDLRVIETWFENVDDEKYEIGIRFNGFVDDKEFGKFLKVTDEYGNNVEWSWVGVDMNSYRRFTIRIKREQAEKTKFYKIYVLPGYTNSSRTLKGEPFYLELPSREALFVSSHQLLGGYDLSITFNKEVKGTVLKKNLSLEFSDTSEKVEYILTPKMWYGRRPASPLESLEDYSKVWYVYVEDKYRERSNKPLLLTISKNTWGKDMSLLENEYKLNVNWREVGVGEESKAFQASAYWEDGGMDGPICVIWCNNVQSLEEVKSHITITPEVTNLGITRLGRSIRISGDWKTGKKYILKFKSGMKYGGVGDDSDKELSQVLENDFVLFLEPVPEYKCLDFVGKEKFFLIPYGDKNYIRVGGRNVVKAYLHIYRVIPENLSYWIGNISDLNQVSIDINERTADYIGSKEIVFSDSVDKAQYLDINIDEIVTKVGKKGLFTAYLSENPNRREVSIGDAQQSSYYYYSRYYDAGYWDPEDWEDERGITGFERGSRQVVTSSIRYFLWTRIGVVAHWDGSGLLGFVHDLVDLSPIAGAEILGYSVKGREAVKGITDINGLFQLSYINEEPKLLIVRAVDDFSILFLSPKPLPTMKDLEKYDKYGRNSIDAFIYTDRNLYRPGETIHLRWIARTNYGLGITDSPLELRIVNPQNKNIYRKLVGLSEFGTGEKDVITDSTYLTGAYSIGLYVPGGERVCGSTRIHIEDFVPDRIKVDLDIGSPVWILGNKYEFDVKAGYFVGPPGANLKCEGKVLVYKTENLWSDKFPGYTFTNSEEYLTYVENLSVQYTDEQGYTTYSYEFLPKSIPTSPVEVAVRVEVSEKGGRAVGTVRKILGFSESVVCGVGVEGLGNKVRANVLVVDTNTNPVSDEEVEVILGTLEWTYVSRIYSSYPRRVLPQWQERFVTVEKKVVRTVDGKAQAEFEIPQKYRSYRIRARRVTGKMFAEVGFYSMGGNICNVAQGPPELVNIRVEDKKWNIGEEVPITIESPFDGKAFVVVQGEKLWESKVVDLVEGKGDFRFNIKPEYYPNVWIAVNAIPMRLEEKSEISPYSTFAFKNIDIDDALRKLNVEIVGLPEVIRPQSKLLFDVITKGERGEPVESELTVAIVDEGIHAILGYLAPDPYGWFGRNRYSPIRRAHYYDNVAYEYNPESPAGDMIARQLSAGKPNITESWIKPFALWSGTVKTNASDGRARLEFDIPEFNGKARVVVVGVGKEKMGCVEGNLIVKRPCVIQTQIPRFLRPGDVALIFARALNTSTEPLIAIAEVSSEVGKLSENKLEWEISPNTFGFSPEFRVECEGVGNSIDLAWRYSVKDRKGNNVDEYSEVTSIPVYFSSRYKRDFKASVVRPGERVSLDNSSYEVNDFMVSDIWVGSTPHIRFVPVLEWLRRYPYGCAEQKISKLYGLYILRRHFLSDIFKDASVEDLNNLFISLLNAIFACQVNNGGIGLWEYSLEADVRASLHTGFLLAMMKRFGDLPVPEKPYTRLMNYLRDLVSNRESEGSGLEEVKSYANMILALDGDPVACERLSLFNTKGIAWELRVLMNYVERICKGEGKLVSKSEDAYLNLQEMKGEGNSNPIRYKWCFWRTDTMLTALKLLNLLLSDANDDEILALQMQLLDKVSLAKGLTTYDLSFVLLALEESMKRFGKSENDISGELVINGEKLSLSGRANTRRQVRGKIEIEVTNNGDSPIFLTTLFEGLSRNEDDLNQSYNSNVEVKMCIIDKDGRVVKNKELKQGEVYYFLYTILPKDDLEGFVLTQLLPAGVELENPRFYDERFVTSLELKEGGLGEFSLIKPEHIEIRDDKLIVACPHLRSNSKVAYICAVRAITKGEFEFPGFFAEDLYNPLVQAQKGKDRLIVN